MEGRTKVIVQALRQLVTEGKVCRVGEGKKLDPYRYAITDTGRESIPAEAGAEPSEDTEKDCGSLVPTYTREPQNHNPKSGKTPHSDGGKAG